jgi:hypothetical protein
MRLSIFLFISLLFACKTSNKLVNITEVGQIKTDVAYLADDKLEGRRTGTRGEQLAADYISKRYKEIGLQAINGSYIQNFKTTQSDNPHDGHDHGAGKAESGMNVIGFWDNGARNTVVIGGHYDHLGYGGTGSGSLSPEKNQIHNGADDNASGIATLLQLAELLKNVKNNNYLFISFSGEEQGLLGSNYWVKNPTIDLSSINYMINMDMVGRLNSERTLAINGTGTSPVWNAAIDKANRYNLKIVKSESGVGPSDHTSFYYQNIPAIQFFTGAHKDYHKPTDDIELVNYDGIKDITLYIHDLIVELDNKSKLEFTKTVNESEMKTDFKVTLGVMPDYLYNEGGMRIDGVNENRPAYNADMKAGDIVIQVGHVEVTDMMSYMKALGAFEKGQTVDVTILREGEKITKQVTF